MNSASVAVLEHSLRIQYSDESLVIRSTKEAPLSGGGTGLVSHVSLLHLNVESEHAPNQINIFVKCSPPFSSPYRSLLFEPLQMYKKEPAFYNQVMADLNSACSGLVESLVPRCYLATEDLVLLEDLTKLGYRSTPKLDLNHVQVAVKSLAEFHSASYALRKKTGRPLIEMYPVLQERTWDPKTDEHLTLFYKTPYEAALSTLEKSDAEVMSKLMLLYTHMRDVGQHAMGPGHPDDVICHGDAWLHNLLFDSEVKRMKLVDFQMIRAAHPMSEIVELLVSSTKPEFMKMHLHDLTKLYHSHLHKTLTKLGCPEQCPSLASLQQALDDLRPLILIYSVCTLGMKHIPDDRIPDQSKVTYEEFRTTFISLFREAAQAHRGEFRHQLLLAYETYSQDLEARILSMVGK